MNVGLSSFQPVSYSYKENHCIHVLYVFNRADYCGGCNAMWWFSDNLQYMVDCDCKYIRKCNYFEYW